MSSPRVLLTGGALLALIVAGAFLGRACRETPTPPVGVTPVSWPAPPPPPPPLPPPPEPEALPPARTPPRPPPIPAAAAATAIAEPPVLRGGAIVGAVKFVGTPPPRKRIRMESDPQCAALHRESVPADDLVVDRENNVRWGLVYLVAGVRRSYPAPKIPVVLEQKECRFVPHVVGVQVDQALVLQNSDPLVHNVHPLPEWNFAPNIGQQPRQKDTVTFRQPEVMIRIKCDIHPWMGAWVGVLDHPFFSVTDAHGRYAVTGLPAGRYTVRVWHERLEAGPQEVDVPEDGTASVDFLMRLR